MQYALSTTLTALPGHRATSSRPWKYCNITKMHRKRFFPINHNVTEIFSTSQHIFYVLQLQHAFKYCPALSRVEPSGEFFFFFRFLIIEITFLINQFRSKFDYKLIVDDNGLHFGLKTYNNP